MSSLLAEKADFRIKRTLAGLSSMVEEKNLSSQNWSLRLKSVGARRNPVISKSWLLERKEVLQKIKNQVRLYLGAESPDITQYAAAYKKDLNRSWTPSDWQSVFVGLQQVSVVFGGDFHPFAQAQRSHLRILRRMVDERPLILAMECLFVEDQDLVNQFLKDRISEEEFLKSIHWVSRWGFPWDHYKPLFEFAKKSNTPLLALNLPFEDRTGSTLQLRDQKAAEVIHQSLKAFPESLHYVIYGDLHIAQDHLPRAFQSMQKPESMVECLSLYLNSENIYFQLAEKNQEHQVEVVKFNDREFCLLTSPPWVKWHSYLMYLEENYDVDLECEENDEDWDFEVDYTDHVSSLVKMINTVLQTDIDTNAVEVYSMQDSQVLEALKSVLNASEYDLTHALMQGDRCFYIPAKGFFYLSKSTVNHAATLAAQYIHARMSMRMKLLWNFPQDFSRAIWIEAMAFLLSKFVNPKRKAQKMSDLKKQLMAFDKEDRGREPLLLALDQKMLELLYVYGEKERSPSLVPREKSSYLFAAKFIGEILGNRYFVLYEQQILGIDNIRALLQKSVEAPEFDRFYLNELKAIDRMEIEGLKS
jgi:hypothetical protein